MTMIPTLNAAEPHPIDFSKHEMRSTKHETNSKHERAMSQTYFVCVIRICVIGACFGFRTSDFEFQLRASAGSELPHRLSVADVAQNLPRQQVDVIAHE